MHSRLAFRSGERRSLARLFVLSCLIFSLEGSEDRQHMNSSTAGSEQWSVQQVSSTIEDLEFVLTQFHHFTETNLLTKCRCDDAVSSSATHGSVSSAGTNTRQIPDGRTDTIPTSNGEVEDDSGDKESTRGWSSKSANRARPFGGKALPTNHSSTADLPYCLDRFVRDIDPWAKARLGILDDGDRGRSRERRKDGAGRWREPRSNSRERRYDQTRVDTEGEQKKCQDGAA